MRFNRYQPQASRAAAAGALALSILVLSLADQPVAAQELILGGDVVGDADYQIGGNLDIAIFEADPETQYTILLVDEADELVTWVAGVTTNSEGNSGRYRLWTRSGVVGCDPGAVHDPANYLFESFAEAESILDGRTFRAVLVDDLDSGLLSAHAEIEVTMNVPFAVVSGYPSDGAGCLRTVFRAIPVHLAISHLSAFDQTFEIFVVPAQAVWQQGDDLIDVRPTGSQSILVPAGADPHVELLWQVPVAGEYQIVVRQGGSTEEIFEEATDLPIATAFEPTGTTLPECTVCPPPSDD